MDPTRSYPPFSKKQSTSDSSLPDAEEASQYTSPSGPPDLEKAETVPDLQHSATTGRVSRIQSLTNRKLKSNFNHPLSLAKTSEEVLVDFDGPDDPYRPLNWPFRKKVITTLLYGFTTMGSTWASAVYSPAIGQISEQFHVGTEVSLLGLSVLLVGFGFGPLIWYALAHVDQHDLVGIAPILFYI